MTNDKTATLIPHFNNFGVDSIAYHSKVNRGKDTFVVACVVNICSEVVARLPGMTVSENGTSYTFAALTMTEKGEIGLIFYEN